VKIIITSPDSLMPHVSFDGLATLDETTKYQFYEWIRNRRVVHRMKMIFTDPLGNVLQYEFAAKFQRISVSNDVKTLSGASFTMKVCGKLIETIVVNVSSSGGSSGSSRRKQRRFVWIGWKNHCLGLVDSNARRYVPSGRCTFQQ
jgi:hypothetical protein